VQHQTEKTTRILYHYWLSPQSRSVRLVLAEKNLSFDLILEYFWERKHEFMILNPAGEVPVLKESSGIILSGYNVISEYLEEVYPDKNLIGHHPAARAEIRRLREWFDQKFNKEVTLNLVFEKTIKRHLNQGSPSSSAIRAGKTNIHYHLDYIGYLTQRRNWLAGSEFSLADITAAAHLSCLDYLGDVPWNEHNEAKTWYARVKSRPSFRSILEDQMPGLPPYKDYKNLDF
jgi:glutathione S-transferase